MARVCDICGKKPLYGNNVSHSHVRTRRRWLPSLRPVHALVKGEAVRLKVCTACIKSGRVTKAGSRPKAAKPASA